MHFNTANATILIYVVFIRFLDTDHSQTSASKLDSREQIANSASNVASNTKEVKQPVVVGETKVPVAETVGQESQQLTAVEKTSANENKTVEKAMAHVGNGNELNVSNTGPTISGSAEQTSNRVIVVANEIEQIKQVVVQETVVTETLTESVQQSPSLPEKATVDEQNSFSEDNEGSKINPEHVVTLGSARSGLLSEDSLGREGTVQVPRVDGNVRERNSGQRSDIIQDSDGCAGKLRNTSGPCIKEGPSQRPSLNDLNEVADKFDEFVEELQRTRTRNSDREQRTQELVQKSEEGEEEDREKKQGEEENEEESDKESEKETEEKESEEKESEEKESENNAAAEKKAAEKKADEKKAAETKPAEKKAAERKAAEKAAAEKKATEKKAAEKKADKKEAEKKKAEKKEAEKKATEKKAGEKKAGEKKAAEKKTGEKKEGERKVGEKKEGEKKEGEKKVTEKKAVENKGEEKKSEEEKSKGEKDGQFGGIGSKYSSDGRRTTRSTTQEKNSTQHSGGGQVCY